MIDYSLKHEADAVYMPTPEQIAADCAEIRKTWSEAETDRRFLAVKADGDSWNLPVFEEEPE